MSKPDPPADPHGPSPPRDADNASAQPPDVLPESAASRGPEGTSPRAPDDAPEPSPPRRTGTSSAHDTGAPREGRAGSRLLAVVERLGNLLPHPVTLFALLTLGVALLSGWAGARGWSVQDPRPEGAPGRSPEGTIEAVSLLTGDGIRWMVENLVPNFVGFVPLGTVLVALLGVGVAEHSGLLAAGIRAVVLKAPPRFITFAIVFAGVISNTASEAGYVVLVPLAAVIFHALGRHPVAGLAAAFAGVSGGYSANLFIGTLDPLLAGITQEAARLVDPTYEVHPAVNWYFMVASVPFITLAGTWVTSRIVEPRLGRWTPDMGRDDLERAPTLDPLSPREVRGLWWAAASTALLCGIIALGVVPESGVLRHPETGAILQSPLLRGLVTFILLFFLIPGIVYGAVTGSIRNDRDVIDGMARAMSTLGLYIVLVFFAAQFVAFFGWTQLGQLLAVVGADTLVALHLTSPLVFIPFILMCCVVNLMLGSASAQWAVTAPIFVPMLMLIGYSPEVIQAAYRIGDSTTNIITPMMSYFGLILAIADRYVKNIGVGTIIATMLPYTLAFLFGWMALFMLWTFGLGLPVGPEAPTFYPAPGH
ncbi:MAG: AbgT family transporter [Deltaproteobacteria bacterium]|nr:MAG: AbgT family transporter [Deltaproteobacteria bacterium]